MIDHLDRVLLLTFIGLLLDGVGTLALVILALFRKPPHPPS